MNRLTIASRATAVPMGAQVYEEEISSRAGAALGKEWLVQRLVVRSLRSSLPGDARLPMRRLAAAGARERRAMGRLLYSGRHAVHRMDLGLPPAPREVVTMHDTVAWRFPDEGTAPASAGNELRGAAAVICVSHHTAEDVAEMFGVRDPKVVHLGVDDRFRDALPLAPQVLTRLGLRGRYILHTGGATKRKNLAGLAAAWDRIASAYPDVSLVLTGPPHPERDALFQHLPRTLVVGRLPGEILPGLMAGAAAVVVPSHYEGFGLPVLEAMAAGAPVVAARTSSLIEVAGDAAVMVETTASSIADGIDFALSPSFPRERFSEAGRARACVFTWERSSNEHAAIWEQALG